MLFAEATSPETWITVGASAVSAATLLGTGLFAYLGSRDRSRLTTLEASVADCQVKHQECEDNHKATKAELSTVKADLTARDRKDRADMEAKNAELAKQIDALRKQVNGDVKP